MKLNIIAGYTLTAAMLLTTACKNENELVAKKNYDAVKFSAKENEATKKLYVNNGSNGQTTPFWNVNDEVAIYTPQPLDQSGVYSVTPNAQNAGTAEFNFAGAENMDIRWALKEDGGINKQDFYSIYPANNSNIAFDAHNKTVVNVTIPQTQTGVKATVGDVGITQDLLNPCAVAYGVALSQAIPDYQNLATAKVRFDYKLIPTILRISFTATTTDPVEEIEVSPASKAQDTGNYMAGTWSLDLETLKTIAPNPVMTGQSFSIKITPTTAYTGATEVDVYLLPRNYTDIIINLKKAPGQVECRKVKSAVSIVPGSLHRINFGLYEPISVAP